MSNFKVVRDAQGNVVAAGENSNHFQPVVKPGYTLTIEEFMPVVTKNVAYYNRMQFLENNLFKFMEYYLDDNHSELNQMKSDWATVKANNPF
jgi:hypothetical protein